MVVACVHAGCLVNSWESKVARAALGFPLGRVPRENWAERVCIPSPAGVYAQVWVCRQVWFYLGGTGKGCFCLSTDIQSPTIREPEPWGFMESCKYYSEQWVPREKRRGKEPRGGHLCSHPMSPLLGRPLHPSGPQFPSLSEEEPRLDDSLALYKFRNLPMLCAM